MECQEGCSCCCNPVSLGYSQFEVLDHPEAFNARDWEWILNELRPITRKEAVKRQSWIQESGLMMMGVNGQLTLPSFYDCPHLNHETNLCDNWENRPDICRTFPWAGPKPDPRINLPPTCSYNALVGRPVQPTAVTLAKRKTNASGAENAGMK